MCAFEHSAVVPDIVTMSTALGGRYHNVSRFIPPLVITRQPALTGTEIFMDAVPEVARQ
jgi:4-aminobutyrate aminotransferase-like enzyme